MPLRFSLSQLLLLSAGVAIGLGLHVSHQRAQDYWLDQWYFEPQSVDFSPDGKLLAIGFPSGEVVIQELAPAGFQRRSCSARWAGRTGHGYPQFVANDRFAFYQDNPQDVRRPYVATWDVNRNRATPGSPFAICDSGYVLEQTYRERNGIGVLLLDSRNEFVVMPAGGKRHRHLALPDKVLVESWDLGADGEQFVVLGFAPDDYGVTARRRGYVIDTATGEINRSFRADSMLLSPMATPQGTNAVAVLQYDRPWDYFVYFRSTEDWSQRQAVKYQARGSQFYQLAPLRFSANGERVLLQAAEDEVVVLDLTAKRRPTTLNVAPRLLRNHPRAAGYVLSSARRSNSPRVALSPDGQAFAVVQDMHVDLWEVDSDRYLGRAWTAWSPVGVIRRHLAILIGFGVITGLIWDWQSRAARTNDWWARLPEGAVLLMAVAGCGGAVYLLIQLVAPLFYSPESGGVEEATFMSYALMAVSVITIAYFVRRSVTALSPKRPSRVGANQAEPGLSTGN